MKTLVGKSKRLKVITIVIGLIVSLAMMNLQVKTPANALASTSGQRKRPEAGSQQRQGTLLIVADEDCKIRIDGEEAEELKDVKSGESRKYSIGIREHYLEAVSPDGKYKWDTTIEVKSALQIVVKTELNKSKKVLEALENKKKRQEEEEKRKTIEDEYVKIPTGSFTMGKDYYDKKGKRSPSSESPAHLVTISRSFEMGKYEVTQKQWEAVMGNNPSKVQGGNLPIEQVSWEDAQEFIRELNKMSSKYVYRLPTEAEWEYACRAGTSGDYAGDLDSMAWYNSNLGGTHKVGGRQPNAWGLYDMHGNVWEWCSDWYGESYYSSSPANDPQGPASGSRRVFRGGCWINFANYCRSAFRSHGSPDNRYFGVGFRLVRTLK